jgi:peptidoglycan hydrolase-like protein with peptidoglycan-binding domain
MSRIYLAPSCQTWNVGLYANFNTNEAEMCNKITTYIVAELDKYQVEVYRGTIGTGLAGNERRANDLGCTSYYAIHTNAGGSTAHGVTALYQSWTGFTYARRAKSKAMANGLCSAIASLGRYNRGAYAGKKQSDGREWFGDLRVPNMPSTILEIEFHTNPEATNWIVSNPVTIGTTIGQAIAQIEGLVAKPQTYGGKLPTAPVNRNVGTKANIILWQRFLCWYGVDVAVDGSFGRDTEAKTRTFQSQNGLVPDGSAGYLTIRKASVVTK